MSEYQTTGPGALSGYVDQVAVRKIHPSKRPLRSDAQPLESLMASIIDKGLLEPIVVRPMSDGFEVVAGNRRFEACKKLKISRVPCHIVELDDKEAYEVSLTENLQRRTLNPIEEGRSFKKYVDELGYGSASELARRIGKSPSYVSRRIALLKLPKRIQNDLLLRGAKLWMAQELLPLNKTEHTSEVLAEFIVDSNITNRNRVRRLVKHLKENDAMGDDEEYTPYSPNVQTAEMRAHTIDRALARCIASTKQNMARFDDALTVLDDKEPKSWVVRESLLWQRRLMNSQVDDLVRLRKRFRRAR